MLCFILIETKEKKTTKKKQKKKRERERERKLYITLFPTTKVKKKIGVNY
jgi:hypothetical protein